MKVLVASDKVTVIEKLDGEKVKVSGSVLSIRNLNRIGFVILRRAEALIQCVYEEERSSVDLSQIKVADVIEVKGRIRDSEKAPGGQEVVMESVLFLTKADGPLPLSIEKPKLNASIDAQLDHRPIALRSLHHRAVFRLQEAITRGFRDYLYCQGFTEIHTPKIGAKSAEGGANVFSLEYFHRPAVLQQSPQFYKQMMVGVFDRVFETGPVFRAEKHNTKRHLNEYTGLDLEMGYIQGFEEIMRIEVGFLNYAMDLIRKEYKKETDILEIELPKADRIPSIRFDEIKKLVAEKYDRAFRNPYDLEPEEEALIGRYAKEEWNSDFVFVTHYPSKKRPFYAMDDPEDPTYTLSFDLLYRGLEVTTGGQRIHDYHKLMDKIRMRKMDTEGMEAYLSTFRYGMPPHGGLGIGLERLVMQLVGEDNVRQASLFPRDLSRLEP